METPCQKQVANSKLVMETPCQKQAANSKLVMETPCQKQAGNSKLMIETPCQKQAANSKLSKIEEDFDRLDLGKSRTSVDMEGTLEFVNYKVGGTQNPHSFTETKYFLFLYGNNFLCI